jgi:hypothetical protein
LAKILPEVLHQCWVHSHEEDTATEMVFRPAHYAFPPSRGRVGFDLKPDGTYADIGIAPADGPSRTEGTWQLLGADTLALQSGGQEKTQRALKIVSADSDRLIIKR